MAYLIITTGTWGLCETFKVKTRDLHTCDSLAELDLHISQQFTTDFSYKFKTDKSCRLGIQCSSYFVNSYIHCM